MCHFVSFPLFGLTSVIRLGNFGFENQPNALIFFVRKSMTLDLIMSLAQMSEFVSFPLFGLTFVMRQRWDQKMRSDLNMPCQTLSDLV